jgi:hypothetical protein
MAPAVGWMMRQRSCLSIKGQPGAGVGQELRKPAARGD